MTFGVDFWNLSIKISQRHCRFGTKKRQKQKSKVSLMQRLLISASTGLCVVKRYQDLAAPAVSAMPSQPSGAKPFAYTLSFAVIELLCVLERQQVFWPRYTVH